MWVVGSPKKKMGLEIAQFSSIFEIMRTTLKVSDLELLTSLADKQIFNV